MSTRGQEQLDFGDGHFIGLLYGDPEFNFHFVELGDTETQAHYIGYANGCPVAYELISPDTGRGAEATLERYAEVNFWFTHFTEMAKESNQELYEQLTWTVPRRVDEPVGKYEPLSVPKNYSSEMAPMNTLTGWALPRLFIKQLGGKDQSLEVAQGRLGRGLDILERAIQAASTPAELLALVAEGVSQADLTRQEVLQSVLSTGWLEVQNAISMIEEEKAALQVMAPEVWGAYSQITEAEKTRLGVA